MDRMYKEPEWVRVYKTARHEETLDIFKQRPYSMHGFDNFEYKGVMYKGFTHDGMAYILLSEPLHKEKA